MRGLRVKDFMVVFLEEGLDQLGDADSVNDEVDSNDTHRRSSAEAEA